MPELRIWWFLISLLSCLWSLKGDINRIWEMHLGADISLHSFLCWFFLSPPRPRTDADTQSRVWWRPAVSLISLYTHRLGPHDAYRGEIINSTATEAQNHIHSDFLLLLAFEIYDDHLIMKFLSCYFSHKSRRKCQHKAKKGTRLAEIKSRLQARLCNLWQLWKATYTLCTLCVLSRNLQLSAQDNSARWKTH